MRRTLCLCALMVSLPIGTAQRPASAADAPAKSETGLTGTWELTFYAQQTSQTYWIIQFGKTGDQWTGKVIARAQGVPPTEIRKLSVGNGQVRFDVNMSKPAQSLAFEGRRSPKDANRLLGTLDMRGALAPAELIRTNLKNLDPYDVTREKLLRQPTGPQAMGMALGLLIEAADHGLKPDEVKTVALIGAKAAVPYGRAMQTSYAAEVAEILSADKALRPIAVEYAHEAQKLLGQGLSVDTREPILVNLLKALQAAGDKNAVRQIEQTLRGLQTVQAARYPGRKGKGNRVVLVELFSGAQCSPCVAADVAFDGLVNTFKPSEAVFLEYHLNIPSADPLANSSAEERLQFYGEKAIRGMPTLLVDGKAGPSKGGPFAARQQRYEQYFQAVVPLLDQRAQTSLTANAVRVGDKVNVSAEVGPVSPEDHPRLRLALVQREVFYTGTNGITAYHQVVRAFVGGAAGLAVTKNGKLSASLDLAKLRQELQRYQANLVKQNGPYPGTVPPLQLKNLEVIAFVQNDKTKQVLQALHVPIRGEGGTSSQ